jgi:hypothetical protein
MGDYQGGRRLSGGLKVIIRILISGDSRQESQCQNSGTWEVVHGPAISNVIEAGYKTRKKLLGLKCHVTFSSGNCKVLVADPFLTVNHL